MSKHIGRKLREDVLRMEYAKFIEVNGPDNKKMNKMFERKI